MRTRQAAVLAVAMVILTGAAALAQQVYSSKEPGLTMPVTVTSVPPQYTPRALAARIQGVVTMEIVVKDDGTVGDVTVTESLDADLDAQAVAAVKKWTFKPGSKDGKPVAVLVTIQTRFSLR